MKTLARILLVIVGLLLIGGALFLLAAAFNLIPQYCAGLLNWAGQNLLLIGGGAAALIGLILLALGLRSPAKKVGNAVLKGSEFGEVLISIAAVENMVLRVIQQTQGIKDVARKVTYGPEGLLVSVQISVMPDLSIPDLVGELQGKIKSYLEEITGILVQEVKVKVDNIITDQPVGKKEAR